ncbi:MAG: FAD-dependent oxidoreductase [Holophaga sp.]|nr:FAD-dependent oxidoreductase [Holophaga sp.]
MKRRTLLSAAAALPFAGLACKRLHKFPFGGELLGTSMEMGHFVRDGALPQPESYEPIGVIIVGGGVAGLSTARHFEGVGFHNYLLLELESGVGGTSRSGRNGVSAYPLAAHYVPSPTKELTNLVKLLDEAGVIEGYDSAGEPIFAEQYLVRSPDERIFFHGQWWEGLYLHAGESLEDVRQYSAFFKEIDYWTLWRDAKGRKAFTLPRAKGSDDPEVRALDLLSFKAWLDARGFTSERLLWLLDYAVRDDFGSRLETTSAWAGIFYFAARKQGPGEESRPMLTWPEGNGFLIHHMQKVCSNRIRTGHAVTRLEPQPDGTVRIMAWNIRENRPVGFLAQRAVFAGPVQMAGRVMPALQKARGKTFFEAFPATPWLVANLTLRSRPSEHGFPVAWDNVIRQSNGLGYVVATHQSLQDHGSTVWTYYHAFAGPDPKADWLKLAAMDWQACAALVVNELKKAHPDIESKIARLDVMRWGHAMIRPRPGLLWSAELELSRQPFLGVHFAHSDLSGLALFEEAQDHGIRAAEEVMYRISPPFVRASGRRSEGFRGAASLT